MSKTELLDLNDDCLHTLCRYFDAESIVTVSQTCTWLRAITEGYFQFKRSFSCYIDSAQSEMLAARTIRKIGMHFTKIDLMFQSEYRSSHTKLLQLLTVSVRPHLTELSILGEICHMQLEVLAPVLLRVEVLTIQNVCWKETCVSTIDLPLLCRKLRKLTISGQIIFAPNDENRFRRLENLDVDFATKQNSNLVLTNNRRLTKLNLWNRRTVNNIDLNAFSTMLRNLEELHLDLKLIGHPLVDLPTLNNFLKLRTIALYSIPVTSFSDILKIVETLDRLKGIILQSAMTLEDDASQQALRDLACNLRDLESFVTVGVDWNPDSVKEFVRHALRLNYFECWSSNKIEDNFITELANIRRLSVGAQMQPLDLKMSSANQRRRVSLS